MNMKNVKPISSPSKKVITLTTDYGWESVGLGVIKCVINQLAPESTIVDLCHTVKSFSILNGARNFEAVQYCGSGIHVAIIDPGVGGQRRTVALKTSAGSILIGPDNGVLLNAVQALGGISDARLIECHTGHSSLVFSGRDVFAYAAGLLAGDHLRFRELGSAIAPETLCDTPLHDVEIKSPVFEAQVVHKNRYGNLVLNIRDDVLNNLLGRKIKCLSTRGLALMTVVARTFSEVPDGEGVICDDGFGRIAIARNQADANKILKTGIGDIIKLEMEG